MSNPDTQPVGPIFRRHGPVGKVPNDYWIALCRYWDTPENWVIHHGHRIAPDYVTPGQPAARLILSALLAGAAAGDRRARRRLLLFAAFVGLCVFLLGWSGQPVRDPGAARSTQHTFQQTMVNWLADPMPTDQNKPERARSMSTLWAIMTQDKPELLAVGACACSMAVVSSPQVRRRRHRPTRRTNSGLWPIR